MSNTHRTPQKPGYLGGINWKAPLIGLVGMLAANQAATQYIAFKFGYQEALGQPIAHAFGIPFYTPVHWVLWTFHFSHMEDPSVKIPMLTGTAIAFLGTLAALLLARFINVFKNKHLHDNTEDLHGSARWATAQEIQATGLLTSEQGVYIGGWTDPKTKQIRYLKHNGPEHVFAFAPTRSGKGVSLVIPTLLTWHDSVIVYDIKGENWAKTSGYRAAAGQLCWKFSPVDMDLPGVRFNPLAEIRIGTNRDVSDAQNLAQTLTYIAKEAGATEDDYWLDSACSLLTGLILHVCYEARNDRRIATFQDLRRALNPIMRDEPVFSDDDSHKKTEPDNQLRYRKHLEIIRDAVHDPLRALNWTDAAGYVTANHPAVAENIQKMLNRPDREFGSVQGTASKALNLYADPLVTQAILASDFHIDDLVNFEAPISLYLVVPPSDQLRLKPLITLIFTMIVHRLTEKMAFDANGKQIPNKHRLLFMIDEFPTLGNMPIFASAMPTMAGYGLKAYLIAQDIDQVMHAYGERESIVSNCHVQIAFAPNKNSTAKLLSDKTGTATVQRASMSYSGDRSQTIMSNVSQAIDYVERPLLTEDEVRCLPGAIKEGEGDAQRIVAPGAMLIFIAGTYPILGTQMLYFLDPDLNARASNFPAPTTYTAIHHPKGLGTPGIAGPPAPPPTQQAPTEDTVTTPLIARIDEDPLPAALTPATLTTAQLAASQPPRLQLVPSRSKAVLPSQHAIAEAEPPNDNDHDF